MKRAFQLIILPAFALLLSLPAFAQDQDIFSIKEVVANEETKLIELKVVARKANGEALFETDKTLVRAQMKSGDSRPDSLEVFQVQSINQEDQDTVVESGSMKVLFLLDLSGSMRGEKLAQAKTAIRDVLESDVLRGATVEFSWFHDVVSKSRRLSKHNFLAVVDPVDVGPEGKGRDTDLYRAIKEKTEELSTYDGTKVLIVLTDGKNDIERNELYRGKNALTPLTEADILGTIGRLDSTYQIYPVGLGSDASEEFLRSVANTTASRDDQYYFGVAPKDISSTFMRIVGGLEPNFEIYLLPNEWDAVFGVEERLFTLNHTGAGGQLHTANFTAVLGSSTRSVDLRRRAASAQRSPVVALIVGLFLLGLLLAILWLSVPIYNSYLFKQRYIRKYREVKEPNVVKKDPLTLEPFRDIDDVVYMNNKIMLLNTWKYYRDNKQENFAGEFSEFFQLQTGGNFFSQKGAFQKLNWLWFGAVGGFITWLASYLLDGAQMDWFRSLLTAFDTDVKQVSSSIYGETMVGLALGVGIVGALATVEELGTSRRINFGRVLLRLLIGILIGLVVFFLEALLIAKVLPFNYVGRLIGWTIFGTVIGWVVSMFSAIEWKNGLTGGLIAGVIAFHFYYLLGMPFMMDVLSPQIAKMISFIIYGGILGFVLFTIVSRLEDFELQCMSPKSFRGRISPIGKWLKSPHIDYVDIGKHPDCYVYIKWDDEVAKRLHARLSYSKNIPYIEPNEGDVLINGKPIKGKTPLNHEDKIQLGRNSVTEMLFVAKEGKKEGYNKPGSINLGPRRGNAKNRSDKEKAAIRQQITIKRRNPTN